MGYYVARTEGSDALGLRGIVEGARAYKAYLVSICQLFDYFLVLPRCQDWRNCKSSKLGQQAQAPALVSSFWGIPGQSQTTQ